MIQAISRLIRQLLCSHDRRVLEGICREPLTYTRQGCYRCPDCERSWQSWKLPEEISR